MVLNEIHNKLMISGRILIFVSVFGFLQLQVNAQNKENSEEQTGIEALLADTTIAIPEEFDSTLDYLLHSWIVQRTDSGNCNSDKPLPELTDSVYKLRLAKMPCEMEMPFNASVRSFIELYTVRKRRQMEYMLGMSDYYFPIFEQVLAANNLPLELKYLPIIESALNTTIVSRMGAAGLWQFMIATGRMYGLEVNTLVDERLDPIKATHAAAHFLKDLYSIYGDWHLVIAAYNCGPGNVNKAIRRAGGKRDFWAIYHYLPAETRGYVPIFIAANYSMHYAHKHNICKAKVEMPVITDTIMVHERIHLEQIASVLSLPIEQVRLLNPQYRKDIVPGNIKPYSVNLPLHYANSFIDKYSEIISFKADSLINNRRSEIEIAQRSPVSPGGSGRVIYHTVKKGQTLSHIAARYGVSVNNLKRWNGLRTSKIQIGKRLKVIKS
ncbi:MAG: transglycosylase SLT domain-containing protein [Paludibacteraceae bacterium]|nr:transglycosylase SLT domain-containing protein [Paludibacteraceae bacterium]